MKPASGSGRHAITVPPPDPDVSPPEPDGPIPRYPHPDTSGASSTALVRGLHRDRAALGDTSGRKSVTLVGSATRRAMTAAHDFVRRLYSPRQMLSRRSVGRRDVAHRSLHPGGGMKRPPCRGSLARWSRVGRRRQPHRVKPGRPVAVRHVPDRSGHWRWPRRTPPLLTIGVPGGKVRRTLSYILPLVGASSRRRRAPSMRRRASSRRRRAPSMRRRASSRRRRAPSMRRRASSRRRRAPSMRRRASSRRRRASSRRRRASSRRRPAPSRRRPAPSRRRRASSRRRRASSRRRGASSRRRRASSRRRGAPSRRRGAPSRRRGAPSRRRRAPSRRRGASSRRRRALSRRRGALSRRRRAPSRRRRASSRRRGAPSIRRSAGRRQGSERPPEKKIRRVNKQAGPPSTRVPTRAPRSLPSGPSRLTCTTRPLRWKNRQGPLALSGTDIKIPG